MSTYTTLAKAGAAGAVVFLLFGPVVGCGGQSMNGVDIITDDRVGGSIKFFLIISIACGGIGFFLLKYLERIWASAAGILCLLIAFLIAQSDNRHIELKAGSYLGIIGYIVVITSSYLGLSEQKKNAEAVSSPPPQPPDEPVV